MYLSHGGISNWPSLSFSDFLLIFSLPAVLYGNMCANQNSMPCNGSVPQHSLRMGPPPPLSPAFFLELWFDIAIRSGLRANVALAGEAAAAAVVGAAPL
jgi:hypothetical protein